MPKLETVQSKATRSPRAPHIADAIREAILRGEYPAGVKLRQEELAARFGTSVIPLREALYALGSEGLVEFVPNRGARVRPISSRELREMAEVRSALAAVGMRLAWPKLTPAAIAKARVISRRLERARDPRKRVELYADFHEAILSPAARPYLVAQIRGIILSGLRYMPIWLEAWKERGLPTTPGFDPVIEALERRHLADTLFHLKRVWAEQEDLVARFLERREAAAKKRKK
jgi:DNA-binding GntR family transcriptional regulator